MGKIRIRTGRGTGTIEVDDDAAKWTGEQYRKIQEARKKQQEVHMFHLVEEQVEENLAIHLNQRNDLNTQEQEFLAEELVQERSRGPIL